MRTGLLLLVACCLWAAEGQTGGQRGRSVWDDPVTFLTKDKDACAMHVTGQGDMTTLRVDCHCAERSYWCDYRGKPQTCRTYNNNPRHYFTQIMWDLRKLHHACSGPIVFKPQMCKKASDEARMVFVGASSDDGTGTAAASPERQERPSRPTQSRPERPQTRVQEQQQQPEEAIDLQAIDSFPHTINVKDPGQEDGSRLLLEIYDRRVCLRHRIIPQLRVKGLSLV
ncbi:hypothetical protein AALO_G00270390 [Alosa alosa]|uniref:Fibroblast growth factor binding protein 2 n=1 Tax=Alosa alosa TaxID=278164 RepID=A0AAV6FM49_9TELE|nr:hypothetical protein AALO_G00270390 [Alosa alosa]